MKVRGNMGYHKAFLLGDELDPVVVMVLVVADLLSHTLTETGVVRSRRNISGPSLQLTQHTFVRT